jgi:hypothetical protein
MCSPVMGDAAAAGAAAAVWSTGPWGKLIVVVVCGVDVIVSVLT